MDPLLAELVSKYGRMSFAYGEGAQLMAGNGALLLRNGPGPGCRTGLHRDMGKLEEALELSENLVGFVEVEPGRESMSTPSAPP